MSVREKIDNLNHLRVEPIALEVPMMLPDALRGHSANYEGPEIENNTPATTTALNIPAADAFVTILLFIFAGFLEIGGGYLVWIGIRNKFKPYLTIPLGCIVLMAYGFVPTLQPSDSFGRIFAVYGGFFIVLSYLWAYIFDKAIPDTGDYIGSTIAIVGVLVAWFYPR